jgi:hypothetical protein
MDKGSSRACALSKLPTLLLLVLQEQLGGSVEEGAALVFLDSYVYFVEETPQPSPDSFKTCLKNKTPVQNEPESSRVARRWNVGVHDAGLRIVGPPF